MSLFLMIKGLKRLHLDFDLATSAGIAAAIGLVVSLIAWCTLVRTGLVNKFVEKMVKKQIEMEETRDKGESEFAIVPNGHSEHTDDDEEYDEEANDETTLKDSEHLNNGAGHGSTHSPSVSSTRASSRKSRLQRWKEKATYGMNVDICDESNLEASETA